MTTSNYKILTDILHNEKTIVFLGAGASHGTGLPLGDAAAIGIINAAFEVLARQVIFEELNSKIDPAHGIKWPRFEVVLEIFARYWQDSSLGLLKAMENVGLSSTHQILAELSSKPRLWLTTNFDDQIERALSEHGISFRVITDRSQMGRLTEGDLSKNLIVKLHGDASSASDDNNMGVRIDQILRAFPDKAMRSLLHLVSERPLLVIGYAARDPDLLTFLNGIVKSAPSVAWIGHGRPDGGVQRILDEYAHVAYYDKGSPKELTVTLGLSKEPKAEFDGSWVVKTKSWLQTADSQIIVEAVADICLERGDKLARSKVPTIHDAVQASGSYLISNIKRSFEAALRSGAKSRTLRDAFVQSLIDIAGDRQAIAQTRVDAMEAAAIILYRTGDYQRAWETINKAIGEKRQYCVGSIADNVRLQMHLGIIDVYQGGDKLKHGETILRDAISLAHQDGLILLELECRNRWGVACMRQNTPESLTSAEKILVELERDLDEIGNPRLLLIRNVNLAEVYRLQARFDDAIRLNEKNIDLAKRLEDVEGLGNALGNIGVSYLYFGRIAEAESHFIESGKVGDSFGGEMLPNSYYNRGWLRVLLSLWEDAIELFSLAEKGYQEIGSLERTGGAISLRGFCHYRLGGLEKAKFCYEEIHAMKAIPSGGDFLNKYKLLSALQNDFRIGYRTNQAYLALDSEERFHYLQALFSQNRNVIKEDGFIQDITKAADDSKLTILFSVLQSEMLRQGVTIPSTISGRVNHSLSELQRQILS